MSSTNVTVDDGTLGIEIFLKYAAGRADEEHDRLQYSFAAT